MLEIEFVEPLLNILYIDLVFSAAFVQRDVHVRLALRYLEADDHVRAAGLNPIIKDPFLLFEIKMADALYPVNRRNDPHDIRELDQPPATREVILLYEAVGGKGAGENFLEAHAGFQQVIEPVKTDSRRKMTGDLEIDVGQDSGRIALRADFNGGMKSIGLASESPDLRHIFTQIPIPAVYRPYTVEDSSIFTGALLKNCRTILGPYPDGV